MFHFHPNFSFRIFTLLTHQIFSQPLRQWCASMRHRRLRNWRGAGRCSFPIDSLKFSTEEIMGAQKFDFAPKFSPNFVFFKQKSDEKILRQTKI